MKKLIPLFIIILFFPVQVFSQKTITGTVTDQNNLPLPGVNIFVKGTMQGTISDLDGNYTIEAGFSDSLVFSMVGMLSETILVGNQSVINVNLQEEVTELGEIVVIGYGTVRKSDLTGSVASVKGSDIAKFIAANPEQGLQGKVTGVQVTSTTGAPGTAPAVRIRGVGTFNNSSPIYVVDGVILDNISFINNSDIESMEVLKDASATAIYGSRGANGVILITTRKGGAGDAKPSVTYNGEYGIQHLTKKIDLLSGREFGIISNEINPGTYNNVDLLPNTDWQDLVFRDAPIQTHQLSATGASERVQYYFSLGYFDQEGIIEKSSYERFTVKLNNTYLISQNLKLGNNITIAPHWQQNAPNVTYTVYRAQPVLVPYYDDGSFGVVYNVGNPLAELNYSNDFNKQTRGVGNIFAEANFLKEALSLRSSFGIDAFYRKATTFTPAYTVYNPDGTESQQKNELSVLTKTAEDNLTWLWENTLNLFLEPGKHTIDFVAGFTAQNSLSEKTGIQGKNIIRNDENFWYINSGSYLYDQVNGVHTLGYFSPANLTSAPNGVNPDVNYSMISFLSRINYTYDGRYILTATFRRDGSSKFTAKNRFSDFPSFAAGWNISKERFMLDNTFISNLKIRGSWGIIGNEKIPYLDRYAVVGSGLVTIFGTTQVANPSATYSKNGNPDLVWESTRQTDLGLEIGVLKNKLTGEFDYYHRVTEDILVELSTPGHLGNGQGQKIRYNAGSVLNTGFEGMITWRGQAGNFRYNIGVLGTTVHNEVLEIGGSEGIDSVLFGGYLGNGIPVTQSRVGYPIGAFYGYKTNGVFQRDEDLEVYPHDAQAGVGDLRFVDVTEDRVINGNDRTFIGSPIPKFIYGFNFSAEYAGFDFSFEIQGQIGNKIFNGKEVVRPDPYNFEQRVIDRWTGTESTNVNPRASFGGYNYIPSDYFIQDGSFLRFRNILIGYTFPQQIASKIRTQIIRIYLKGSNLYTITKFTGYTPEIGATSVLDNGIDNGTYPIPAVYSAGINLTF